MAMDAIALLIPVNPLVQGWQAPIGTMGYSFVTTKLYVKIGGTPTDWTQVSTSQADIGVETVTGDGVDNTDPQNPIVTGGGSGSVTSVTAVANSGITVGGTAEDPIIDVDVEDMQANLDIQAPSAVAITGGSITGVAIDGSPRQGTALTNADQTVAPGTDAVSEYVQEAATPLTAARAKTISVASMATYQGVRFVRKDTGAFNMTFVNGGTNATLLSGVTLGPATADYYPAITFVYNGVDMLVAFVERLRVV